MAPLKETVDAEYGPCLGQYAAANYALEVCMGIPNGEPQPAGYKGFDSTAPMFFFAQQQPTNCESHMSRWSIVGSDIGGAIGGAMIGTFFNPGVGTVYGAINGAGLASANNSWGSAGRVIQCRKTNGGGGGSGAGTVQKT